MLGMLGGIERKGMESRWSRRMGWKELSKCCPMLHHVYCLYKMFLMHLYFETTHTEAAKPRIDLIVSKSLARPHFSL
jgi:hypothetical protein